MACSEKLFTSKRQWLDHRGIGGSDLAILMGDNRWGSLHELYQRLALGIEEEKKSSQLMDDGTKAEPNIRNLFALDNPMYEVTNPPKKGYWLFTDKDKPYMTVTPDGLIKDKERNVEGGLEIKYVSVFREKDANIWENNGVPMNYFWQVIQYMAVMPNLQFVILNAHLKYFRPGLKGGIDYAVDRIYLFTRDDYKSDIEEAVKAETSFYENCVMKKAEPKTIYDFINGKEPH